MRCPPAILSFIGLTCVLLCSGGCASTEERPEESPLTSVLAGDLAMTSFPSPPTEVEAISELGSVARTAVRPDGNFRLALVRGHRYRVLVKWASGSQQLVFPQSLDRIVSSVMVVSGAVHVGLGKVRLVEQVTSRDLDQPGDVRCENGGEASPVFLRPLDASEEEVNPCQPLVLPGRRVPGVVGGCDRNLTFD